MKCLARVFAAALVGVAGAAMSPPALAQEKAQTVRVQTPELQTVSARRTALVGVVSDERGGPVSGAMVTIAGRTTALTISDDHGRFAVDKLPAGEYVLRAHLAGFAPSPRRIVQVGGPSTEHRLQVRRLNSAVGTVGATLESRPIIAAGFDLPKAEDAPASADGASNGEHPHSEIAWRLRHIKRSILKSTAPTGALVKTSDEPVPALPGRALPSADTFASGIFPNLPLSGEVNLLTTSAVGPEMWSGTGASRGVAYFSLGAPTAAGDWLVRGAMSQGDLSSWVMAGSFVSKRGAAHTYEAGLTYSTQEYIGGNPAALAAVKDGSRNVGQIRIIDRWALSPDLTIEYGGRYARFDYLQDRGLLSPQVGVTLEPASGTRVKATLAQRMVAPGAEEFLTSSATGPWLPPERTFAPLDADTMLRAERARYLDVLVEHEFEESYVLGLRRFFQQVDDQLVTMFGLSLPDGPRSVGHYYVASAGSLTANGWGVRFSSPASGRVRATLDYTLTRTEWIDRGALVDIARWAPAAVRADDERIHDLTTSIETDIPETSTRVFVVYKLNSAFTRTQGSTAEPGTDGRFEFQVHQALPFDVAGTRWEVLVGVRNLFRDTTDPASVYDELLVVRPPTRVLGGFLVRF